MFKSSLLSLVLLAMGQAARQDNSINPPKPGPTGLATMDVLLNTFWTATARGETVSLLLNSDKGETSAVFKLGAATTASSRRRRSADDDDDDCHCHWDDSSCHCHDDDDRRRRSVCSSDADCPSEDQVCSKYGNCIDTSDRRRRSIQEDCDSDADCPAEVPVCSEYGYCTTGSATTTTSDRRRRSATTVTTGSTNTTTTTTSDRRRRSIHGECSSNADCPSELGQVCFDGFCTGDRRRRSTQEECSSNADCPAELGQVCSDGFCTGDRRRRSTTCVSLRADVTDSWCEDNCFHTSPFCPEDYCSCS